MNLTIGITNHTRKYFFLKYFAAAFLLLATLQGCTNNKSKSGDDDETTQSSNVKSKIEVSVTSPRIGTISQYETLNATTVYMLSDVVHAPLGGYVRKVNVLPGQAVKEGDILFTIQSKEAAAINIVRDTSLHMSGTIVVKATGSGIVKTLSRQVGSYVQDGDELCTIASSSSLVFMLDVPFEMRRYIKDGGAYTVILPDGSTLQTHVTSRFPEMDKAVQMEHYELRSSSPLNLPAGLIANVKIPTDIQSNAIILPKGAILCNETQNHFWVMKLVHDSLAIKTPIEKGAETKDSVQVKSPVFSDKDKILVSGNYGMPDTALVKVIH